LKEPIQISFIDKFNTVEAGIDGGGVTKEFLTSVTNEAFKSGSEPKLFEENDQHLLYPNPAAVEQRREVLRQLGFVENSPEWNEQVRDLLRRYEFLGRIIGKCLYEGILVDVNFAPFFLLKWALTGGAGSAQRETAYRANLNDLKDLDQGLYQGLVSGLISLFE
jgi:ubiquitin-protein ligase E3 C